MKIKNPSTHRKSVTEMIRLRISKPFDNPEYVNWRREIRVTSKNSSRLSLTKKLNLYSEVASLMYFLNLSNQDNFSFLIGSTVAN